MVQLQTNAPTSWPVVSVSEDVLQVTNKAFITITFAAAVRRSLEAVGGDVLSLGRPVLTSEGIFDLPCKADVGGEHTYLLFYTTSDEEAARHYQAAAAYIREKFRRPAYYLAPGQLDLTLPAASSACRLFQPSDLNLKEEELELGECAMWFPTPEEQRYVGSTLQPAIRRAFESAHDVETFLFRDFAVFFSLLDERERKESLRVQLPAHPFVRAVEGPRDADAGFVPCFYVNISAEKGIRFLFPKGTSRAYQKDFWNAFAAYAEEVKRVVKREGIPFDEYTMGNPLDWYLYLEQNTQRLQDEGNTLSGVSVMLHSVSAQPHEPIENERRSTPVSEVAQETHDGSRPIPLGARLFSAIAYLPFPFMLVSLFGARRNHFTQFHIKQGITLLLFGVLIQYPLKRGVQMVVALPPILFFVSSMLLSVVFLIIGVRHALAGHERSLPFIGVLAQWLPFWRT